MDKKISIRILQLKNNFYCDDENTKKTALGNYCVIGYFDSFDISEAYRMRTKDFHTWKCLGELTAKLDGEINCRMVVCVTEQEKKDRQFWNNHTESLYFITMVRTKAMPSKQIDDIIDELKNEEKKMGYFSYDHSEIIIVTKTNKYSDGIGEVKKLRTVCKAIKTYTVFAVKEKYLDSYETIRENIEDERVYCRLHCMVKDYGEAENFITELQACLSEKNGEEIQALKFETFGGYDWMIELNAVSICSIFELYKMGELLTHANELYAKAFFNIESEILVKEEEPGEYKNV